MPLRNQGVWSKPIESCWSHFFSPPPMICAGYVEIVQFLINSANGTDGVKRMVESVDAEGDTVSSWFILDVQSFILFDKQIAKFYQLPVADIC